MRQSIARLKTVGFIVWHTKHEMTHVLLGLLWAWYLREQWHEFNPRYIWLAVFGSILPDADHILYVWVYGRKEWYALEIKKFLHRHQWRNLWTFIEKNHKKNTGLVSHNYFFMLGFLGGAFVSSLFEWQLGVILFGAIVSHYIFDIFDDVIYLGRPNPNWRRLRRIKEPAEDVG